MSFRHQRQKRSNCCSSGNVILTSKLLATYVDVYIPRSEIREPPFSEFNYRALYDESIIIIGNDPTRCLGRDWDGELNVL
jgi:hypothetical protein